MQKFCGLCGSALSGVGAFCSACGTRVEIERSTALGEVSETQYNLVGTPALANQDETVVALPDRPLAPTAPRGTIKKILLPACGLLIGWHVIFALLLSKDRCLDEVLPPPSCRATASLWVNPLTDAATLTAPSAAKFGISDKDIAAGFKLGFDFVASNVAEKSLNDSARKYFDLYAMVLPYRVMVEEKNTSERPAPFDLKVTGVSSVKADPQGHLMIFVQAHSQDERDFVLVCHTSRASCAPLQIGNDFTFTVLQSGDRNYAYDYTGKLGGVVVSTSGMQRGMEHQVVFTLSKRQQGTTQ